MAAPTTLGYDDLPSLLVRLTGDEKHDESSTSTLDAIWVLYDRVLRVDPVDPRDEARDRFILGDPVRVSEEIARYRERLGVTTMIFRLQWPGMDQERVLRSIRLLGEQVLPQFA